MGAGVQPVPGPTLPESSSAARKAWLRNGSPLTSRSQAKAFRPETPDAIFAMTSVSRSAIAFPNEGVGMNRALRALFRGADRPAVDGHALAEARNPGLAERCPVNGEEIPLCKPECHASPEWRSVVPDDDSAPRPGELGHQKSRHPRIEAHDTEGTAIITERG